MLRLTSTTLSCGVRGHRGPKVKRSEFRWFSSSADQQRRRENSARLRALRKSQRSPAGSETSSADAGVNYRYRKENRESVGELWGEAARKAEMNRQQRSPNFTHKKKFVPFFEEIDAIVEDRKRQRERKESFKSTYDAVGEVEEAITPTLASVFDSLGDPPGESLGKEEESPPDLKSLLRSLDEDSQTDGGLEVASSSPLGPIFASLKDPPGEGNSEKEQVAPDLKSLLHSLDDKSDDQVTGQSKEMIHSVVSSIFGQGEIEKPDSSGSHAPEERSIFDAFPIREPPPPRSPNAFEEEAYREYMVLLEDIVTSKRFGRRHSNKGLSEDLLKSVEEWLRFDEKAIDYDLPMMDMAMSEGLPPLGEDQRSKFRLELEKQRTAFMENRKWNEEQYDAAKWAVVNVGHRCARLARSLPLDISWEKIKEAGMALDNKSLDTYLFSCTTYSGGRRHSHGILGSTAGGNNSIFDILGRPSGMDQSDEGAEASEMAVDGADLPEEVATFHDLLYEPTEQSLSIRVRALVAKGDAKGAEELLDTFPSEHGDLRHRTYLPVLKIYLEKSDVASAMKVFRTMRDKSSVLLEPETYVQVISALAENGYFSPDSEPIAGAEKLGYSAASGPRLFDQIATEMSEDILEVTSASARRLYTAFASAFKEQEMGKKLTEIHPLAPLAPMNESADDSELIVSRVAVDASTGICPRSGAKLRLINLEGDQRKQLRSSLLELSKTSFTEFKQKFKKKIELDDDYATKNLSNFASWLDNREGRPFTAIVDGANVAFFMQNFHQGKFNFHQIQFMVDTLEKMNENPLVILPFKYYQKYFKVLRGTVYNTQVLDEKEQAILFDLTKRGKLYRVPKLCLDDYYWMLASVSDQTKSRDGMDLSVSPGNEEGRWAGTRPMLVTNDQMRDHKLELLEPRLFRRWYSCHIVNYNFTAFVDDECVDTEIGFSPADFFSREIQGNPSSCDAVESEGGTAWHFPVSDWELHERFCIRIPRSYIGTVLISNNF